uniref:Transmembrane protein n=1 Tax=Arundo donax TaxID=35708 RepID=A0A0A9HVB1_ARUDO
MGFLCWIGWGFGSWFRGIQGAEADAGSWGFGCFFLWVLGGRFNAETTSSLIGSCSWFLVLGWLSISVVSFCKGVWAFSRSSEDRGFDSASLRVSWFPRSNASLFFFRVCLVLKFVLFWSVFVPNWIAPEFLLN